jgi:nicotinamide-nucleotide amidase
MARILADCGIGCTRRTTIGDNWERLVGALSESLERADVLITIGGLGPTVDDLTRDAIAAALGDELEEVPEVKEKLERFFSQRGIPWNPSIGRQAQKPTSATLIDNPNGTAPGLRCQKNGKVVIALPGPKGEFDPMAHGPVKEILSTLQGNQVIHSRTLRISGMGESQVEAVIRDLMDTESPTVAPYAHTGEVHLRLTARAESREAAARIIDPMEQAIRERLGSHVFGVDDHRLEDAVIELLEKQGATLAVSESMTGGELGARLTSVSGASKVFLGGAIAYSVAAKEDLSGVSRETVEAHGPVSEETATAMAEGIRKRLGSTYGIAITGNAGPTVDVDNKPVGLVFVAMAWEGGSYVDRSQFRGVREDIRRRASQVALGMLRNKVLEQV